MAKNITLLHTRVLYVARVLFGRLHRAYQLGFPAEHTVIVNRINSVLRFPALVGRFGVA